MIKFPVGNICANNGYNPKSPNISFNGTKKLNEISKLVKKYKETDALLFKVKAKDLYKLKRSFIITSLRYNLNESGVLIVENPFYEFFKNKIDTLQFKDWAVLNLNRRGFPVPELKGNNPDDIFDVIILKSPKILKGLVEKYDGKSGNKLKQAYFKTAMKILKQFCEQVGNPYEDMHYSDAADVLQLSTANAYDNLVFKEFLDKFNVKKINYEPSKINDIED